MTELFFWRSLTHLHYKQWKYWH